MEQDQGDGPENHDDDEARKGAPPKRCAEGDAAHLLDAFPITGQFEGLAGKGFDAHDAGEGLADDGVGAGHGILRLFGQFADEPAKAHRGEHGHRQGAEHQQGQLPAEGHQSQQAAPDDDGLADELGQDHGEGVADRLDVGGDAAAEVAHPAGVEEGHRLGDHAGKGVFAQRFEHPRRDFTKQPNADEAERALHDEHRENGEADVLEVPRIDGQGQVKSSTAGSGVHAHTAQLPPQSRDDQGQDARDCDERQPDGELDAVGPQIRGHAPELTEAVAVQFAFAGRFRVGVRRGGAASGQ